MNSVRTAAVVGLPIDHSLSPLIHTAWLQAAGLQGHYAALAPNTSQALVELLDSGTLIGCNVTAPYKGDAYHWALDRQAEMGAEALRTGSVNLLILGDRVRAESTDGQGMIAAIRARDPAHDFSWGPTVIVGAGGAACAALHAVQVEGSTDIRVVNRTLARAETLSQRFGPGVSAWSLDQLGSAVAGASMLINAASQIASPDLSAMARGALVMDMTYRPLQTPLLEAAQASGLRTVDGLAMLIGQARPSFLALFGCEAPDVDVRSLCLRALEQCG
ncbi:MAG: shikimate dehydrogenase [Caulobacterales bacterium]|nr:shikimate dehydrogenase [Caulobacterales bacterium]